jgi:hypothetical protein
MLWETYLNRVDKNSTFIEADKTVSKFRFQASFMGVM